MAKAEETKMEKIISLCKRRGFIFQGSEIYGGLAGTWDFGPLGVALRNNIKNLWWKKFVTDRDDIYGIDAAILMNQNVWKASGHVAGFSDPMVVCTNCNREFRVDTIITDKTEYISRLFDIVKVVTNNIKNIELRMEDILSIIEYYKNDLFEKGNIKIRDDVQKEFKSIKEESESYDLLFKEINKAEKYMGFLTQIYLNHRISCPNCNSNNKWGIPRQFNMMFKTNAGPIESDESITYLRPETAQGMFVNFKNILDTFHPSLPFGMAQIGKAFRNEIAPRDFVFRSREFEQMEIEYFLDPRNEDKVKKTFEDLHNEQLSFLNEIGLDKSHVHPIEVPDSDRAHYSKRSVDTEFDFPFGRKELLGIANRTDYDLGAHIKSSKVDLTYYDEETKERITPYCIEPTFGLDRLMLAVLSDAYTEDVVDGETRVFLKFSPKVAPVKVAVFPLLKNKPELVKKAQEVFNLLRKDISGVVFDDNGNIGKRYRRQDEIGTPYCVTIDFDTIEKDAGVTVRNRDTGKQERVKIEELKDYLKI